MTDIINIPVESKDFKEFQEKTGMSLSDCIKILINSVKYGGRLGLEKAIDDLNYERRCVNFTDEEWKKFVNEKNI